MHSYFVVQRRMTLNELENYGIDRMDDEEVKAYLSTQSLGVLGLPTEDTPYQLPMSYGFDGESRLYFTYVVGSQSRKAELSTQAETASFLVYSAETMFNWRSVLLTGTLQRLPEEKRAELKEAWMPIWRPELLEIASKTEETQLYEFQIKEMTGLSHDSLPPAFHERRSSR